MKAASLGACAPIGCVTKINAYVMPRVTIKNTIDKTAPMRNINRALISSWLNLSLCLEAIAYQILRTGASHLALRFLALFLFPIFVQLAWVSDPPVITTPGKA
jgi:hypothetical protein